MGLLRPHAPDGRAACGSERRAPNSSAQTMSIALRSCRACAKSAVLIARQRHRLAVPPRRILWRGQPTRPPRPAKARGQVTAATPPAECPDALQLLRCLQAHGHRHEPDRRDCGEKERRAWGRRSFSAPLRGWRLGRERSRSRGRRHRGTRRPGRSRQVRRLHQPRSSSPGSARSSRAEPAPACRR
jgi:hypothetical protein